MTPRRQSARLQAKIQSPAMMDRSGTDEVDLTLNSGDKLDTMQHPDCDNQHERDEQHAASPSKVETEEIEKESHLQTQVQIPITKKADQSISSDMDTSADLKLAQKHDDAQSDPLPHSEQSIILDCQLKQEEPGAEDELDSDIDGSRKPCESLSSQLVSSSEQAAGTKVKLAPGPSRSVLSELPADHNPESPSELMPENVSKSTWDDDETDWDDEDLEEAAIDLELSGASSPNLPLENRVPQSLPRNLHTHRNLQWTPSKTRKVSLRTATLLKRSAQYPLVPLAELKRPAMRPLPPKVSPLGPRTSTGSRDMDITQDFDQEFNTSDISLATDVDQYSSSDSSESDNEKDQNQQADQVPERAPALAGFLTPQRTKQRTLRRMSNPEAPVTPKLRSRSSWQWLRSFFASPSRDSKDQPPDDCPTSERDSQTQPPVESITEDKDEFYDVQGNESAVNHSEVPAYEAMDVDPESPSRQTESGSPDIRPITSSDTPDLRDLKHVFAVQPDALSVSPMADFRHFMRPDKNAQEDISLEAAWNTLTGHENHQEEVWSDVEEYPSPALKENHSIYTHPQDTLDDGDQPDTDRSSSDAIQPILLQKVDLLVRSVADRDADTSDSAHISPSPKPRTQENASQEILSAAGTVSDVSEPSVKLHHSDQNDELQISKENDSAPTEQLSDKENEPYQIRDGPAKKAMSVAYTEPESSISKGSDTASLTPRRTPRKVPERAREPLRSSPRLKEAQKQPCQSHNIVSNAKATRMMARPVRHKEPYVPVRRQLPARSSIRQFRVQVDPITDSSQSIGHTKPTKRTFFQGTKSDISDHSLDPRSASSSIDTPKGLILDLPSPLDQDSVQLIGKRPYDSLAHDSHYALATPYDRTGQLSSFSPYKQFNDFDCFQILPRPRDYRSAESQPSSSPSEKGMSTTQPISVGCVGSVKSKSVETTSPKHSLDLPSLSNLTPRERQDPFLPRIVSEPKQKDDKEAPCKLIPYSVLERIARNTARAQSWPQLYQDSCGSNVSRSAPELPPLHRPFDSLNNMPHTRHVRSNSDAYEISSQERPYGNDDLVRYSLSREQRSRQYPGSYGNVRTMQHMRHYPEYSEGHKAYQSTTDRYDTRSHIDSYESGNSHLHPMGQSRMHSSDAPFSSSYPRSTRESLSDKRVKTPTGYEGTTFRIDTSPHSKNYASTVEAKQYELPRKPFPGSTPSKPVYYSGKGLKSKTSDSSPSETQPKRGGKLPKPITDMLKTWLLEHAEHPYPTEEEKRRFCEYTGLDICQISNWFVNARRRILAPQIQAAAGKAV
ncbi:hypothetical protein MPSI1_000797 [Malassezia psittaci]|uniref:Homeobox domain-containing protein n=1 Tax=Malassezia psittaci TaxID=1821823 RepID=A0AAF0FBZ9_9BASI|nr:hypothetical protein MPSI1_000797 [Malassezia psittaci]